MPSERALFSRLASALSRRHFRSGGEGAAATERGTTRAPSSFTSTAAAPFSTSASSSSFSSSSSSSSPSFPPPSFAEIRQYTLHPSKTADFIAATADTIHLRKQMPFLAMLQGEVGDLNTVTHFYLYADLASRDGLRAALASNREWTGDYLPVSRACVASQTTMLVQVEAEVAAGAQKLAEEGETGGEGGEKKKRPGVFDFTVAPRSLLVATFGAGSDTSRVSARAAASERHGGVLALRGHVVVGSGGPHVTVGSHVEVWRFADAEAAITRRTAADAPAAGVSRQLLRPLTYSPWQ